METRISEQAQVAFEPELVPPLHLMRQEGVEVLEEWFRWAEEWSMLLRIYGGLKADSAVLEIGCGLGRIAFPLRYLLSEKGSYDGFDICENKIAFLKENFQPAHPNFRFEWADIHNTHYNPGGKLDAADYPFPYAKGSFDLVFAASVLTHVLPRVTEHYFQESARVLKRGGLCVFSLFLLDNYRADRPRPAGFSGPGFSFDSSFEDYGPDFAIVDPRNPDYMTGYRLGLIKRLAHQAGLKPARSPMPGMWSGAARSWVCPQDLIILTKG